MLFWLEYLALYHRSVERYRGKRKKRKKTQLTANADGIEGEKGNE
jgi:hypothetical protein